MQTRFKNYSTYYDLVMACALLSNDGSPEYRRDAAEVIDFYCRACGLTDCGEAWKNDVLDVLDKIELLDEREALYSERVTRRQYDDLDILLDVKGDVLSEISTKYRDNGFFVNAAWFDYSHIHRYNPDVRFAQIKAAASSGWRVALRESGIMLALGIGCERDLSAALYKFLQCTYWCDVPSCSMAAYLYGQLGDEDNARVYGDLRDLLDRYLKDGVTVVPADVAEQYDKRAVTKYALLSSIYRDVCCTHGRQDVDYSFVEVMMSDAIDDNAKMGYVNNYERKEWRNVSNPVVVTGNRIGFDGGKHD